METANCGCCRDDLPWEGRGTNLDISGCRFSLYPMTDNFVSVILGALEKTDTSAVWGQSRALFNNAWQPEEHMALEGQFSKGCPGDTDGDSLLDREGEAPNRAKIQDRHFPVLCKLALYPMGTGDYIDEIAKVWRMAEAEGLNPKTIHYATRIEGDVQKVFDYLEEVCRLMEQSVPHYILHFTLSVNSPTNEG